MVTPAARREATTYLRQTFEMSERRACRVIGTDRASMRYQSVRPDDVALRERLKALAQERGGSATVACTCCCGAKATPSTGSGCSGSTARSA